ncbi:hypothetical protein LINPERHAP2_LOCUS24257 [Linum perenne]
MGRTGSSTFFGWRLIKNCLLMRKGVGGILLIRFCVTIVPLILNLFRM